LEIPSFLLRRCQAELGVTGLRGDFVVAIRAELPASVEKSGAVRL
jgi:hypothetical protein